MTFWNPWNDSNISTRIEESNHNPNESLSRLIHSEIFNNLDTSNLNDKFTFLDDTYNHQLLANESINQSKIKQLIEVEVAEEANEQEHEKQDNLHSNQIQHINLARFTPSTNYPYNQFPEEYYNYSNYQTAYLNNLRPSSVLSSVSSNDFNSDFDSSISSNSTDARRYSPNIYNNQMNLRNLQFNNFPYYSNNDPNTFTYGNEYYYQPNIDPNYYYYNQNRQYVKPNESLNSLSRSQSTQSLFKPFEDTDSKLPVAQIEPSQPKVAQISSKKKLAPNVNDLNSFKYPSTSKINPNIKINLQDYDLWMQFKKIGTEMIITKPGRRMFPVLRFSITGLDENKRYIVFIDIQPTEVENRYKFNPKNGWIKSLKSEPHTTNKIYIHPETPMMGSILMNQILSFHKIKLTNSASTNESMITLNSMHRYIPRLHVIEEGESVTTFNLEDCIFFAVTSYQNDAVTKLKIQHNPYAKGFKEHVYKDSEKCKTRRPDYDQDYNNLSSRLKLE